MKLAKTVVNAIVVTALGFGAAGLGTGVASAKPGTERHRQAVLPVLREPATTGTTMERLQSRPTSTRDPGGPTTATTGGTTAKVRRRGAGAHRRHTSGPEARLGRSTTGATT